MNCDGRIRSIYFLTLFVFVDTVKSFATCVGQCRYFILRNIHFNLRSAAAWIRACAEVVANVRALSWLCAFAAILICDVHRSCALNGFDAARPKSALVRRLSFRPTRFPKLLWNASICIFMLFDYPERTHSYLATQRRTNVLTDLLHTALQSCLLKRTRRKTLVLFYSL